MKKFFKKVIFFILFTIIIDVFFYFSETSMTKGFFEYSYPIILLDIIAVVVCAIWIIAYKVRGQKIKWNDL